MSTGIRLQRENNAEFSAPHGVFFLITKQNKRCLKVVSWLNEWKNWGCLEKWAKKQKRSRMLSPEWMIIFIWRMILLNHLTLNKPAWSSQLFSSLIQWVCFFSELDQDMQKKLFGHCWIVIQVIKETKPVTVTKEEHQSGYHQNTSKMACSAIKGLINNFAAILVGLSICKKPVPASLWLVQYLLPQWTWLGGIPDPYREDLHGLASLAAGWCCPKICHLTNLDYLENCYSLVTPWQLPG